ncbi:MAG: hypothetical protein P9M03_00865 [Candidatus Theseobacter exili]|nr:hypothetical protein [Candidatus Theseobacter exili]
MKIQKLFLNHRAWSKSNPARASGFSALQQGLGGIEHSTGQNKWGEIKVTFDSKPRWSDEITFRATAYLKSKKSTILSGEVTYINVPKGQKHSAVMYIHPLTIRRYGEIKKMIIEAVCDGQTVDLEEWPSKSKKKWWKNSAGRKGLILSSADTPFFLETYENNEALKPKL